MPMGGETMTVRSVDDLDLQLCRDCLGNGCKKCTGKGQWAIAKGHVVVRVARLITINREPKRNKIRRAYAGKSYASTTI
jgi:hypothetical protein